MGWGWDVGGRRLTNISLLIAYPDGLQAKLYSTINLSRTEYSEGRRPLISEAEPMGRCPEA